MILKHRIVFLLFTSLFSSLSLQAQLNKIITLSGISYEGLTKTDHSVVNRQLLSKIGNPVSENDLVKDAQRLRNLPGIQNVEYTLDTIVDKVSVTFKIDEVRTLLPIINFGGIEGNIWYQLGITDINWLGKGNNLTAFYRNSDGRHSGQIYYRVPRVGLSKWGYSVSLSRWASREPLFFPDNVTVLYNYDFNNLGITGIYKFTQNRQIELGGSYFIEKYKKLENEFIENLPGPEELSQPKILSRFNYSENYVNYFSFVQEGFSWNILYQNVFNLNDNSSFNSLILQANYYKIAAFRTNIAMRVRFGVSSNKDSPFAPFVVDSHINLRGVGNRIDRGTAQFVVNIEGRKTVLDRTKWASQLVVFSDSGTWRDPGEKITDLLDTDSFRQFLGGGFRIIYKKIYGSVLRIDYGLDIYNPSENGIVIGYGQYF